MNQRLTHSLNSRMGIIPRFRFHELIDLIKPRLQWLTLRADFSCHVFARTMTTRAVNGIRANCLQLRP